MSDPLFIWDEAAACSAAREIQLRELQSSALGHGGRRFRASSSAEQQRAVLAWGMC